MHTKTIIKRFNELSQEELYRLLNARQEVFTLEQGIIYQDLDFIDQKSIHILIIDQEKDKLIAYLRIIEPGVKYTEASIGRVLTMPDYRGEGFGRTIMIDGIRETIERFGLPIKIEAQEYLVDFYESLGFRAVSSPFILEGISHVEMIMTENESNHC